MATYGERLLAQAEARAGARTAKRRRVTLLFPTTASILWALSDLVAARVDRLEAADAGFIAFVGGVSAPVIWTVLFVLLPAVGALKRDPLPMGMALAFLAGPVLSPFLFGPGGWKWWQITIVMLTTVFVLGASLQRPKQIVLD